jgi:hypothetical protein
VLVPGKTIPSLEVVVVVLDAPPTPLVTLPVALAPLVTVVALEFELLVAVEPPPAVVLDAPLSPSLVVLPAQPWAASSKPSTTTTL